MSEQETQKPLFHKVSAALGRIGFLGERKAISLLILGYYVALFALMYVIVSGVIPGGENPQLVPMVLALLVMYGITFFGVAAGWFFGRWVAIGIGSWGATMSVWAMISQRELNGVLVFFGLTHAVVAALLSGDSMSPEFEGRGSWRKRLGVDDEAVARLRKTVTRAASSVPAIVLFVVAPRPDEGEALLALVVVGLGALLMGRTISLLALAAASIGALVLTVSGGLSAVDTHGLFTMPASPQVLGLYASLALAASISPFVAPVGRFLRRK